MNHLHLIVEGIGWVVIVRFGWRVVRFVTNP
jgi:hypothetical protein